MTEPKEWCTRGGVRRRVRLAALWLVLSAGLAARAGADEPPPRPTPITVSLGGALTVLEQSAFRYALQVRDQVNDAVLEHFGEHGLTSFVPELVVQGGADDTFDSIIARLQGAQLWFATTLVDSVETPDSRAFLALPASAGLETTRRFRAVNGLVEVGVVPWIQGALPPALRTFQCGLFAQAGYKFRLARAAAGDSAADGAADQSAEAIDRPLLRLKANVEWTPATYQRSDDRMGLGIPLSATGWRDLADGRWYYSLSIALRVKLRRDIYYDTGWQRGSGAPTFNEGEQYSSGLTVTF